MMLPDGVETFLADAGWQDGVIEALPGDASSRRYFRIHRGDESALLMDSPLPHEDPAPFLRAALWLEQNAMRAPRILADRADIGLLLIEDFGTTRMRDYLDDNPGDEVEVYGAAIDALLAIRKLAPGPFLDYSLAEYLREVRLFTDWYCPAQKLEVDVAGYITAWEAVLQTLLANQTSTVSVLRDYHAENIMLLDGLQDQGLLDFQDALNGHPAYDLVSLLQDARRDVSAELEALMIERYLAKSGDDRERFLADYAILGAQRNAKVVGIFVRLCKRDGKARYLDMIPRVWKQLERDLAHPVLASVAAWFDANVPEDLRKANGGEFVA